MLPTSSHSEEVDQLRSPGSMSSLAAVLYHHPHPGHLLLVAHPVAADVVSTLLALPGSGEQSLSLLTGRHP